jgi:hypothetical protein
MNKYNILQGICFIAIYNIFLGGISYALLGITGLLIALDIISLACLIGLLIGEKNGNF